MRSVCGGDTQCATLYLEAVEGRLGLSKVLRVMRRVLLCMMEAAEGELCVLEVPEVPDVVRCATLSTGGCGRWDLFVGGVGGAGDDALCTALYAGGSGGRGLFAGDDTKVLEVAGDDTLYAGGQNSFC